MIGKWEVLLRREGTCGAISHVFPPLRVLSDALGPLILADACDRVVPRWEKGCSEGQGTAMGKKWMEGPKRDA